MKTQVRAAVPEDRDPILALMVEVIRVSLPAAQRTEIVENVTGNLAFWSECPESCVHLVAQSDSMIIGVVLVKEFWNLCSLFVAPQHQGRGVGRMLVLEAIAACREPSQGRHMHLNAAPDAVPFYAALGFEFRDSAQRLPPGFKAMRYRLATGKA